MERTKSLNFKGQKILMADIVTSSRGKNINLDKYQCQIWILLEHVKDFDTGQLHELILESMSCRLSCTRDKNYIFGVS